MSRNKTIISRQNKEKQVLLEILKKTPIVQIACERSSIGRATFYRWKKDDKKFAEEVAIALDEGKNLINDMAESQLLSAIRDKNLQAIIFWLRNHHYSYKSRVEVTTRHEEKELTKEQKELIKQAILLAQAERKEQNE